MLKESTIWKGKGRLKDLGANLCHFFFGNDVLNSEMRYGFAVFAEK